jgi:hypothetical protein
MPSDRALCHTWSQRQSYQRSNISTLLDYPEGVRYGLGTGPNYCHGGPGKFLHPPAPIASPFAKLSVSWDSDQSKKKRRLAEANRHLPVNSRPLIGLLTIGGHDRQQ